MKSFINKEKLARQRELKSALDRTGGGRLVDLSRPGDLTVGETYTFLNKLWKK